MKVELIDCEDTNCQFWTEKNSKKTFNVYGIYVFNGEVNFLLKSEEYGHTPTLVPFKCFKIVDSTFYSTWVTHIENNEFSIICKEWVEFSEHLNFFASPWEFEDDFEILQKLDSFHYWVEIMDHEFDCSSNSSK